MKFSDATVKRVLSLMPESLRQNIIRSNLNLTQELDPSIHFKIAETKDELEQAFKVLHDAYVDQGYQVPNENGMRITKYHALPTTTILVAKEGNTVIGTLSIVRDSKIGVPADGIFDLSNIRKEFPSFAEISSLAIHKNYRGATGKLLFPFVTFMVQYINKYSPLDAMFCVTHPLWYDFYTGILCFDKVDALPTVENYSFANGNPAMAFIAPLDQWETKLAITYLNKPLQNNLFKYIKSPSSLGKFPQRTFFKVTDPSMNLEFINYFFRKKSNTIEQFTERELSYLKSFFTGQENYLNPKSETRFISNLSMMHSSSIQRLNGKVLDVSENGLKIKGLQSNFQTGSILIKISPTDTVNLQVEQRWSKDNLLGLHVIKSSEKWMNYINYLNSQHTKEEDFLNKAA